MTESEVTLQGTQGSRLGVFVLWVELQGSGDTRTANPCPRGRFSAVGTPKPYFRVRKSYGLRLLRQASVIYNRFG